MSRGVEADRPGQGEFQKDRMVQMAMEVKLKVVKELQMVSWSSKFLQVKIKKKRFVLKYRVVEVKAFELLVQYLANNCAISGK